jgi:two-component system, NtrC family, response regulator GlrR
VETRGTLVTTKEGRPALRRIVLRVTEGPDAGKHVQLARGTLLVGTHEDCELQLTDPQVSRRHAEVQLMDDGLRVADLGSKNGTFAGGARIEAAVLAAGAKITLGSATVVALEPVDEPLALGGAGRLGGLTTRSPTMQAAFDLLGRAAKSEAGILLEGETGVGKDLLARTIHEISPRAKKPFVVIDCAAIAPTLVASELFGHKKGAFTGATGDRAGAFEEAAGGTVFIDEVGELPIDLQPMLLRALETREVRRVGETTFRKIDVRVIAATNRSLREMSAGGSFRSDLFFRLAVIALRIPPLRERKEDLDDLIAAFLAKQGRAGAAFAPADLQRLRAWSWPGNVRELRNVVEQSAALSAPDALQLFGLYDEATAPRAANAAPSSADSATRAEAIGTFERQWLVDLLKAHGGNVSKAAAAANVSRNHVHRLMKRYAISRDELS